jgi:hypothetical protein
MTVPRGYVDGTLTAEDSLTYLQKLGISEDLYDGILKSFAFVPGNYSITNKDSGKVYSSSFVPTKPDEGGDFEAFLTRIQGESENWDIQETGAEDDSGQFEGTPVVTEQHFELGLIAALGPNPSLSDIRYAAEFYGAQLDAARANVNQTSEGDDRQFRLATIDAHERSIADKLSAYVAAYKVNRDVENARSNLSNVEGQELVATIGVIEQFNWAIMPENITRKDKTLPPTDFVDGKFKLNSRKVAHLNTKGKPTLHLGVIIAAAKLAGRGDLIEALSQNPQKQGELRFDADTFFPNAPDGEDAFKAMKELAFVDPKRIPNSSKLVKAANTLSFYMRVVPKTEEKKVGSREKALKQLASAVAAIDASTMDEYFTRAQKVIDTDKAAILLESINTGNELIQAIITVALEGNVTPNFSLLNEKLKLIDAILNTKEVFGSGGIEGISRHIFGKGEDISDKETLEKKILEFRGYIRKTIDKPLRVVIAGLTTPKVKDKYDALMSGMFKDYSGVPNILFTYKASESLNSVVGVLSEAGVVESEKSVLAKLRQSVASAIGRKEMSEKRNVSSFLLENPDILVEEISKQRFSDASGRPISPETTLRIAKLIGKYSRGEAKEKLQKALGALSSKIDEAMVRGTSALVVHTLTKALNVDAGRFTAESEAFTIIQTVLSGKVEKFDPTMGSFISTENAIFAEVLTRARVLPPVDADTNEILFDSGLKNFITEDYRRLNGSDTSPTDIELLQHMAHTDTYIPYHYLLTNNIRQASAYIKGTSKHQATSALALTDEEHKEFIRDLTSSSHHPAHDETEEDMVGKERERADAVTRNLESVIGTHTIDTKTFIQSMREGKFTADSLRRVDSLISVLTDAGTQFRSNSFSPEQLSHVYDCVNEVVESRIRESGIDSQEFIDYWKGESLSIRDLYLAGGMAGHGQYLEPLGGLPEAMHQFTLSGGSSIQAIGGGDDSLVGFSWTGKDGSRHEFGKLRGVASGSIDRLHVRTSAGGEKVEINPIEIKMYEADIITPEIGSVEHITRFMANMWKKKGKPKIAFNAVSTINSPYNTDKKTTASYLKMNLDRGVTKIQTSGSTIHASKEYRL